MRYGFIIPNGDVRTLPDLASDAEAAGWDGVFIPDCICIDPALAPDAPGFDPWVALGAMAVRTERVFLGTMLTPVSRRRPWKLARETATLDRLSDGRLILPVGLGALDDGGFGKVGEATDRKTRAELLDEGLAILTGLWSGRPFSFRGEHYQVEELTLLPPPVQAPRIPIWVAGLWPHERSLRRALRYDGLLPNKKNADGTPGEITPDDIRAMKAYVAEHRLDTTPFDIVWEGRTPGDDPDRAAAIVRPFAEAGTTWWMDSMWLAPNAPDDVRARIRQGPPRID
jgi:alkanesulfonate monooxygenase SsuD/methylene tetrahydromethanopterin reductase-like flavin-dependent oxidoreductase (luciferase family)